MTQFRFASGFFGFLAVLAAWLASVAALAQSVSFTAPTRFPQTSGEALYRAICQGCHMPDAQGAVGAGRYPALARNENLAVAGYPVHLVVYGRKGMPGFGGFLSDAQVAAVVNYVRSHFGNDYADAVSAEDVGAIRQPGYEYVALE
jgi:mono/diheme cytochrome c family protein